MRQCRPAAPRADASPPGDDQPTLGQVKALRHSATIIAARVSPDRTKNDDILGGGDSEGAMGSIVGPRY